MSKLNPCRYSYPLGSGFRVSFKYEDGAISASWAPKAPSRQEFASLADAYRAARDAYLSKLGLKALVIEL